MPDGRHLDTRRRQGNFLWQEGEGRFILGSGQWSTWMIVIKCTSQRFEIMAEDVKRLLTITEKLTETGARLMLNGSVAKGGSGEGR